MKRSCLILLWCALVACAGQEAGSANANPTPPSASKFASHQSRLVPARYFVNPANRRNSVRVVRLHTDRGVTLAGHYSQSVVGCGTECWANWVIDRWTGAIIDVPYSDNEAELIDDVRG